MADEIAKLALTRFIDSEGGFLREFFTADWSPAAGDAGRRVEPGHQFEWAVLLARWSAARGDPSGLQAAHRLYRAGRAGVDAARGVAVDAITPEGTVLEPTARLWPQTEWLKAALILNQSGDILLASQAMSAYLQTPVPGLWRDRLSSVGQFDPGVSPASSLYHIAAAIGDLTDHVGSLAVA